MNDTFQIGDTVFTYDDDLAVLTRIEERNGETQFYGIPLTGPLNNSTNAQGELNEFLLTEVH